MGQEEEMSEKHPSLYGRKRKRSDVDVEASGNVENNSQDAPPAAGADEKNTEVPGEGQVPLLMLSETKARHAGLPLHLSEAIEPDAATSGHFA